MCCAHDAHGSEPDLAVPVKTEAAVGGMKLAAEAVQRVSQLDVEIAAGST